VKTVFGYVVHILIHFVLRNYLQSLLQLAVEVFTSHPSPFHLILPWF